MIEGISRFMKTEKLTIEHLAPYLPYGLKVQLQYGDSEPMTINGLSDIEEYDDIKIKVGYMDGEHIWMFKPYLRPLSQLTEEITHNGETFVPIVALFNLRYAPNAYEIQCLNTDGHIHDMKVWWDKAKTSQSLFYYNANDMCFGLLERSTHQRLPFQHQMFQKLYEWHFDIHVLISSQLALELKR